MRSSSLTRCNPRCAAALLALTLAATGFGCHEYVNPWEDETVPADVVTTASVSAARAQHKQPVLQQRPYEQSALHEQDGSVSHFPLWFEDPFEDRGSEDGRFAWGYQDYMAPFYGLARMVVNTIGVPVSAVVHPPVPLMVSDGIPSRKVFGHLHDAEWHPDGATVAPPDIIEAGADTAPPAAGA
jgi:hypothetical protein